MNTSFNKQQAVASIVKGASSVLGVIHAGATIVADLSLQAEVSINTKYVGAKAIDIVRARILSTGNRQDKLGLTNPSSVLLSEIADIQE